MKTAGSVICISMMMSAEDSRHLTITHFLLLLTQHEKEDMVKMLEAAQEVSSISLSADFDKNIALKEGIFWADAN